MKRFLAFLCTVAMLLSLPIVLPLTADAAWSPDGGLTFAATDNYQLTNKITRGEMVTIETTFKIPTDMKGTRQALMGNLYGDRIEGFFLEKNANGYIHYYAWMENTTEKNIDRYEFIVEQNVATGDWVHLAVVLNKTFKSTEVYINGAKCTVKFTTQGSSGLDEVITAGESTHLMLGRINPDNTHASVKNNKTVMKDVAFYKDARTAAEIKKDMKALDRNADNLLVAYDLSHVNYWYDLSGNGNHLTARAHANGDTLANTVVQEFKFSAVDTYMAGGTCKTIPKTISTWVKIPDGTTGRSYTPLSNFVDENHEALSVEIHNNGQPRVYIRRNVNGYDGDSTIKSVREECKWNINLADGAWHHVEFVIGEGLANILCYVDGTLIADKSLNKADKKVTTALSANPNPMRLGQGWKPGVTTEYFRGALGSIACYSDLRTAAEVSADYNAGKSTYRKAAADYADAGLLYAYDMLGDFTDDLSANGNDILLPALLNEGLSFTGKEDVVMSDTFEDTPVHTFEAEIYVPLTTSGRAGVITGNYMDKGDTCMVTEINTNGNPRLYFSHGKTNASGAITVTDITFTEVDVRTGTWAHVAIVFDEANDKVYCYLNGELKQTKDCTENYYEGTFNWPFMIGSDYRTGNVQYFKGNIKSVALFSDVRTADEIKADFAATTLATTDTACLGAWEFDGEMAHGRVYQDLGPANNDVTYTDYWFDKTEDELVTEFAYSFAIVGDTQGINDTGNGSKMAQLYDWIVANKQSKNIQYVVGVGDITEHISLSHATHTKEWEIAVENIGKLDAAGIPHIQVRGNHDHPTSFNKYFGVGTAYGDTLEGTYNGTAANSYKRFTIGNTKWLFLTLDHGAAFGAIEWAAEVIDRYSDHKVIVATHGYMYGNGDYHTDRYDYSPAYQTLDNDGNKVVGGYNGDELWAKLISQHENITMVLCGHNYGNVIPVRQDMGVHGNIVTQVLVDFQYIDQKEEDAGIVTMFYFSADGSTVEVETYSTLKNKYYRAANQFTMSLTGEENPGRESDSYGWLYEGTDYCFEIVYPGTKIAATDKVFGVRYKTIKEVNAVLADIYSTDFYKALEQSLIDAEKGKLEEGATAEEIAEAEAKGIAEAKRRCLNPVVKLLGNVKSNVTASFQWTATVNFTIDGGGWIYDAHAFANANDGYVWQFRQSHSVTIRNLTMISKWGCIYVRDNVKGNSKNMMTLDTGTHLYADWSYRYKNPNYYLADFGTDTNGDGIKDSFTPSAHRQTALRPASTVKVTVNKGTTISSDEYWAILLDDGAQVFINGGHIESVCPTGTVGIQENNTNKILTINGGTFVNRYYNATTGAGGSALRNGPGQTTINGGTFIAYGAPVYNVKADSYTRALTTAINGGVFIAKAPAVSGAAPSATSLIYVSGNASVTVNGGLFLNERAQTTALYSAGGNTVTVTGGRFFSLTTASDNLSLTEAQKAKTVAIEGKDYYLVQELLPAADANAPTLLSGAEARLSTTTGIRFISTVQKIDGATYGTIIVPTDYVIKALALQGGITEANLIAVSKNGKIAKIEATEKGMIDNGNGTLTLRAALTGLASLKDTSFTAISYTVVDGVTYYSQVKLADNSRSISRVASAALSDVALVKGGENTHNRVCNVDSIFNDGTVQTYSFYNKEKQELLVTLMTDEDLAACKAAIVAKYNAG